MHCLHCVRLGTSIMCSLLPVSAVCIKFHWSLDIHLSLIFFIFNFWLESGSKTYQYVMTTAKILKRKIGFLLLWCQTGIKWSSVLSKMDGRRLLLSHTSKPLTWAELKPRLLSVCDTSSVLMASVRVWQWTLTKRQELSYTFTGCYWFISTNYLMLCFRCLDDKPKGYSAGCRGNIAIKP